MCNGYPIDCFEVSVTSTGYIETFPGNPSGGFDALECFNALVRESEVPGTFGKLFDKYDVRLTRINARGKIAHVITN